MENKQLERELKSLVQGMKGEEVSRVTDCLEREHGIYLHRNFTSKPIIMQSPASTVPAAHFPMTSSLLLALDVASKRLFSTPLATTSKPL